MSLNDRFLFILLQKNTSGVICDTKQNQKETYKQALARTAKLCLSDLTSVVVMRTTEEGG